MVVSPQLLTEYQEVLLRPQVMKYTGLTTQENIDYIAEIKKRAYVSTGDLVLNILTIDPDDNMVLATAKEGMATHLVTGNKKHFPFAAYENIQITSPAEFLKLLTK
mgnify:CR=1 FL=1